jgi:hypothetical protein
VRYSWDTGQAQALWQAATASPPLSIHQSAPLFVIEPLPPGEWRALDDTVATALARVLRSSSFLTVRIDGQDEAVILVQEDGMARKPSLLLDLSLADILRCWSALTPEQKQALLERRYQELMAAEGGTLDPTSPAAPLGRLEQESIFDTFAGYFHGFAKLKQRLDDALRHGREKEAIHLLFGEKYDSLPQLLGRVASEDLGAVERYVVLLCARQLLDELAQAWPAFVAEQRDAWQALDARLSQARDVRASFTFAEPAERDRFLDWFERWFLKRAEPREAKKS